MCAYIALWLVPTAWNLMITSGGVQTSNQYKVT